MTEDEKIGNGGSETESTFLTGLEKEENQALREMTGDSGLLAPPLISKHRHVDRMCEVLRQTLLEY